MCLHDLNMDICTVYNFNFRTSIPCIREVFPYLCSTCTPRSRTDLHFSICYKPVRRQTACRLPPAARKALDQIPQFALQKRHILCDRRHTHRVDTCPLPLGYSSRWLLGPGFVFVVMNTKLFPRIVHNCICPTAKVTTIHLFTTHSTS